MGLRLAAREGVYGLVVVKLLERLLGSSYLVVVGRVGVRPFGMCPWGRCRGRTCRDVRWLLGSLPMGGRWWDWPVGVGGGLRMGERDRPRVWMGLGPWESGGVGRACVVFRCWSPWSLGA